MQVRETSIEAYNYITSSGVISERRAQIYAILYKHGPLTAGEALKFVEEEFGYRPYSSTHGRFTELRDMGVVKELGKKKCDMTGREVILWDVTAAFPTKIEKMPSNKELVGILSKENERLRELLRVNNIKAD